MELLSLVEPLEAVPPLVLPLELVLPEDEVWLLELLMLTVVVLLTLMVQILVTVIWLCEPGPVFVIEAMVVPGGQTPFTGKVAVVIVLSANVARAVSLA